MKIVESALFRAGLRLLGKKQKNKSMPPTKNIVYSLFDENDNIVNKGSLVPE